MPRPRQIPVGFIPFFFFPILLWVTHKSLPFFFFCNLCFRIKRFLTDFDLADQRVATAEAADQAAPVPYTAEAADKAAPVPHAD